MHHACETAERETSQCETAESETAQTHRTLGMRDTARGSQREHARVRVPAFV